MHRKKIRVMCIFCVLQTWPLKSSIFQKLISFRLWYNEFTFTHTHTNTQTQTQTQTHTHTESSIYKLPLITSCHFSYMKLRYILLYPSLPVNWTKYQSETSYDASVFTPSYIHQHSNWANIQCSWWNCRQRKRDITQYSRFDPEIMKGLWASTIPHSFQYSD